MPACWMQPGTAAPKPSLPLPQQGGEIEAEGVKDGGEVEAGGEQGQGVEALRRSTTGLHS